jgi:hypothetical protein
MELLPTVSKHEIIIHRPVTAFLDIVHRLYFNKITAFQKLDLLPSSGKKGEDRNPSCWAPWLS